MTYRIRLPEGGPHADLDIVEPSTTAVQRALRRDGLAGYEPPTMATLLALFASQDDGFVFFDIGANMGLYAATCARLFAPGRVHAFEPAPPSAEVVRKVARSNRLDLEVFEVAVGDANGTASLHLSDKSDASNSLVPGFKKSSGSIEVRTVRLDDHVRATGAVPDVMKIDVETFEPQVIAGATRTIADARPIIVLEVLKRRGHDHGEEITAAMQPFGYHYYPLSETPDWTPRDEVQGGSAGVGCNDWLLAPEPLDESMGESFALYRQRLRACQPQFNSRVPLTRAVVAAIKRGGIAEVIASGRRYRAERRGAGDPDSTESER